MNEDQFLKLFRYIEDFRGEVIEKLDKKAERADMESLTNTIDRFLKRLDDNETEQAARDAQFDRLLKWAREVSKKTGVPLPDL